MKTTSRIEGKDTFEGLCKELGKRVRGSGVENALLCYRAYQAYLGEHPKTAHGKARGNGQREVGFRHAAAKASGVCASTIDALLQVGKAMRGLPKTAQEALASSSLQDSILMLRKLSTKKHEEDRESLIIAFAKQEKKSGRKEAMLQLKKTLGLRSTQKPKVASVTDAADGKIEPDGAVKPKTHKLSVGEHFDVRVGRQVFRVQVKKLGDGGAGAALCNESRPHRARRGDLPEVGTCRCSKELLSTPQCGVVP